MPFSTPARARMAEPPQTERTYLAPGACFLMNSISSVGAKGKFKTGSGIGPTDLLITIMTNNEN